MNFIRRILALFDRKQKKRILMLLGLMIVGTFFEVMGLSLIMPFMALLQGGTDSQVMRHLPGFARDLPINTLILYVGASLLGVYLFKNAFLVFMYHFQFRFVFSAEVSLSRRLLTSYLSVPYTFHLRKNTAGMLKNITIEVLHTFNQVLIPLLTLVSETMVIIALLAVLLAVDPAIAGSSILVLGSLSFLFFTYIHKRSSEIGKKHQYYYEQIFKWINQGLGSIKETKVLNREPFFIDNFTENMTQLSQAQFYPQMINQAPRLFIETLMITAILLVVLITQSRSQDFNTLAPMLALFGLTAFRLMPSINRILSAIALIRYYKSSVDAVHRDLIELPAQAAVDLAAREHDAKPALTFTRSIEIQDVSYSYPETSRQALNRISLTIPHKQAVALVGPTGSGKSTLVDLILGLLKPVEGRILVDGTDIQTNISRWQRSIGYIPQSIYLTDDTIRRNVAFGLSDTEISDERVWEVLKIAQLDKFVRNLPEGLDTSAGERGVRLSGGERQRIGIARALYHDPQVLIMDEATSALDNQTEMEITQAIERLSTFKTLIVIAHRLSTVKNCQAIYMINDGKLIDRVTYEGLMSLQEKQKAAL